MNSTAMLYQGQSVNITFSLDDDLEGELYVGIYRYDRDKSVMMFSTGAGTLEAVSNRVWKISLCGCQTRELETGVYYIEMLVKNDECGWSSVGKNKFKFVVNESKIGKEVML